MSRADTLTASRLFLAPVFFAVFTWGPAEGPGRLATAVLLLVLFAAIELSDLLDGMVARGSNTVSSFGKLFDPFADVFARVTYFVCFSWAGLMPLWILLVILYREFGILFLRMMLAEKGVAMGGRPGGKLKAVTYMVAGSLSLLYWVLPRLGIEAGAFDPWIRGTLLVLYVAAAVIAVASFVDYYLQFRRHMPRSGH